MRLIDADKLMQMIPTEEYNARMVIANAPTVDAEPTEEQVKEYCRKRCLVIVTSELFNEMKARWSAEPVRHGHWCVTQAYPHTVYCSECFQRFAQAHWMVWEDGSLPRDYCPHCGAKMDW